MDRSNFPIPSSTHAKKTAEYTFEHIFVRREIFEVDKGFEIKTQYPTQHKFVAVFEHSNLIADACHAISQLECTTEGVHEHPQRFHTAWKKSKPSVPCCCLQPHLKSSFLNVIHCKLFIYRNEHDKEIMCVDPSRKAIIVKDNVTLRVV